MSHEVSRRQLIFLTPFFLTKFRESVTHQVSETNDGWGVKKTVVRKMGFGMVSVTDSCFKDFRVAVHAARSRCGLRELIAV